MAEGASRTENALIAGEAVSNRARKGSVFERDICHLLSLWWTQHLPEPRSDVFWRTSTSGARATTRRKKGLSTCNQSGDICATDPIGQPLIDFVTFELKRGYNSTSVQDLIDKPKKALLNEWIEQATLSHQNAESRGWAIVWRRDLREALVIFDANKLYPTIKVSNYSKYVVLVKGASCLVSLTLKEFLKNTDPRTICEWAKTRTP